MKLVSLFDENLLIITPDISPIRESLAEILDMVLPEDPEGEVKKAYLEQLSPQIRRGGLKLAENVALFHLTIPEIGDSRLGMKLMGYAEGTLLFLLTTPRKSPKFYLQVSAALRTLVSSGELVSRMRRAGDPVEVLKVIESSSIALNPRILVRDVMRRDFVTVESDDPLKTVVDLMVFKGRGGLMVTDRDKKVLGVITESDLVRVFLPEFMTTLGESDQRDGEAGMEEDIGGRYKAKDIMSRSVMCISEDTPITEVAALMINKKVRRIPVVKEGKLIGIASLRDIIRGVLRSWFV
jgi:CBS domain-containing protein